ncbi:MAG: glycosyltransferase [Gomphosphaeria aponina SAG 52.96 = DSM 107014]|uniref:Glycosyltransferase n=1 Tax=Gomphosphaeria aponina SAG 52.96 = DSM 107014 TaxID=1521640 RepID=A0A941GR45_9CHRO|nr:glycosyltransferase [Gomphosphaeria aponina SAG 52.96 = DSM 107014]
MIEPKVAIVIPVFKHSVLVGEAIASTLNQETEIPFVTIIVNDGCTFPETDRIGREFAQAYPDKIYYLYRPNGGLSAARNTGIDFAYSSWTSIEAIYLLDADNRISPQTIEKAYGVLRDEPEVGWVYPTINVFGVELNGDYRGEYSILQHLRFNPCEAGSMVRRAVFAAGCRYDESMKLGYEDWEFWWQAMEAGFRGKHLPEFGFQYRKRFESMLKNSQRDNDAVVGYMKRKHSSLFKHHKIIHLEQQEAPRYGIFLADTGEVVLTSDPGWRENTVNIEKFKELYHGAQALPGRYHRPYYLTFTRGGVLDFLEKQGLLRWVFWRLEQLIDTVSFLSLSIEINSDQEGIKVEENPDINPVVGEMDHLLITTTETMDACIADTVEEWIQSLSKPQPLPKVLNLRLKLSKNNGKLPLVSAGGIYNLLSAFKSLRSGTIPKKEEWTWYSNFFPPRFHLFRESRLALESGVVYPMLTQTEDKHIGFILPIVEFGGVEKVALNIAKVFKDAGWQVHLFVINAEMGSLPEWAQVFDTINFFQESSMYSWVGSRYMGTKIDDWSERGDQKTAVGLLSWLNVVINFHSVAMHAMMGVLRRYGVKTAASVHVHDLTPGGRPCGFAYTTLGYEHAYDYIIPCSEQMHDWCHGMGVPESKLIVVPNACGYPIEQEEIEEILVRRWERQKKGKLRVLFIGRFDRQKGLDRLVNIVVESRRRKIPIDWRLVGKNIVANENAAQELEAIADLIEPPVYNIEELNEVYGWADVLLLPSYWEGLPLTVLEAMRLGVVVVASNVGAMTEAIDHEETGFLIENMMGGGFVEKAMEYLEQLAQNPDKLEKMSKISVKVANTRNWEQACAKLIESLELSSQ